MVDDALLLLLFLLLGAATQVVAPGERVRDGLWVVFFWTLSPVLVFAAFTTFDLDDDLVRALAAAIVASWAVGLAGYLYARAVSHERDERGALTLAASFGNTGFVGFPLAQLAFGAPGLALAVVYDRLSWLVPATSVSTSIARLHGRRVVDVPRSRLRALLANPPLLAFVAAVGLRVAGVDVAGADRALELVGTVIGPFGFFLLGLSVTLERGPREPAVLRKALGAVAIRCGGGPLALLGAGLALGADVPGVFYLLAAMPAAFHLLVLARVYDVRPALMNRIVVGSTVPAVAVVVVVSGLAR